MGRWVIMGQWSKWVTFLDVSYGHGQGRGMVTHDPLLDYPSRAIVKHSR